MRSLNATRDMLELNMTMPTSKPGTAHEQTVSKVDEKKLELDILSAISSEAHRPSAIVNILGRRYDQNKIVKTLIALEKDGNVEREGSKAWIAKGKALSKGKEGKKEKEKLKKE
jgi:hypothetical protein